MRKTQSHLKQDIQIMGAQKQFVKYNEQQYYVIMFFISFNRINRHNIMAINALNIIVDVVIY